MKKWICLFAAVAIYLCCPAKVYADVVFDPIDGEFGRFVIFAVAVVVIILLVTALLLIILKKKGKK